MKKVILLMALSLSLLSCTEDAPQAIMSVPTETSATLYVELSNGMPTDLLVIQRELPNGLYEPLHETLDANTVTAEVNEGDHIVIGYLTTPDGVIRYKIGADAIYPEVWLATTGLNEASGMWEFVDIPSVDIPN